MGYGICAGIWDMGYGIWDMGYALVYALVYAPRICDMGYALGYKLVYEL